LVQFFNQESTQAFLAASDNFAILAFRGTECDQLSDLLTDADLRLTSFPQGGKVHQGFFEAFNPVWDEKIKPSIDELGLPTWYTGHSLCAAQATLAAAYRDPAALYTFGSPRVGDAEFVQLLEDARVYRAVDCADMAANLPPPIKYGHVGEQYFITSAGKLLLNPSRLSVSWHKLVGESKYAAALPWLRRGVVWSRAFADHAVVNYTAAFYHLS
jgi:predicted lipase